MEKSEDAKISHQHKSAWFSFIKSLATFKGDLSSLTAPPFLLSPQSIIEFSAYWCETPSIFIAPALENDPEKRALLVLQWFLSTLKQQHNNRDDDGKKKKMKPLNPFLGETFKGEWRDDVGTTKLAAEQVSHHPPITAFNLWNDEHGIRLQGNVAPHVHFKSTVHIDRKGYSVLHIDAFKEDYLITMPKIWVNGLMTGALEPELSGSSYIRSSSGYTAKIEYSYKGWLGGKKNSFTAQLLKDGHKDPLYILEGIWTGEYTIKDMRRKDTVEKIDVGSFIRTPFTVKPIREQTKMESRKVWKHVAAAIEQGDMFTISKEKSKIENEQRELRRKEKAEGTEFQRRYFTRTETSDIADGLTLGLEKSSSFKKSEMHTHGGLWVWDQVKYNKLVGREGMRSPRGESFDSGIGMMDMSSNE